MSTPLKPTDQRLVRGADKQPAMGKVSQVIHWTVHAGKTRIFYVRTAPPTRVELTVSPTFSPHTRRA